MAVEFFEVVVGGFKWFYKVLGRCRSFHLLVTTVLCGRSLHPRESSAVRV